MTVNPKFQNKEIKKGLYIIPTPIGNLGDITYRAIEILKKSDFILCEDTRISRKLMEKFGVKSKLLPNHKFNEKKNLSQIINHLRNDKIISLRYDLIKEELGELKMAMNKKDLKEVADALTDILYVTYGAGHAFGINLDKCFDEVQNSNMSKLDENGKPIYNEHGKVMKGPNYFKPDLSKFVS